MADDSVRKGIRRGDIEKDTYERLTCADCGATLRTEDAPDEPHTIRVCPDCGRRWTQLG